jgi:hypothetical protein
MSWLGVTAFKKFPGMMAKPFWPFAVAGASLRAVLASSFWALPADRLLAGICF